MFNSEKRRGPSPRSKERSADNQPSLMSAPLLSEHSLYESSSICSLGPIMVCRALATCQSVPSVAVHGCTRNQSLGLPGWHVSRVGWRPSHERTAANGSTAVRTEDLVGHRPPRADARIRD